MDAVSAGLGNVNLTLGLNTSPATQALQQYYQKLNQGAQGAAKSQKPVETALGKLVEGAKRLGFTYDKTNNKFKDFKGRATDINTVKKRVDELNASLNKTKGVANNAIGGIGAGFKQVLQGIPQGIGLALGQQLLAPLTNFQSVVGGAVKDAVGGFVEIDKQLRQTISISGDSSSRFGELSKAMNELAAATKFTAGELSEASVALARAGLTIDEIKEALPGIAQGAAAAGEDIGAMSDVVVAALGGFQISTSETTEVVDILTAAANNSNTSVTELGDGLKYVGPIANSLGLTFEDTAAAAALLANSGIKASQMGTALRGGLTRLAGAANGSNSEFADLSRGTGRMAEALKRLAVDATDSEGNLKRFPELIKSLKSGFDDLGSTEKSLAAKILFGDEAGTAWISLLNQSNEEIDRFAEITNNASGTAAETAAKNLAGISGSLDLLRSAFDSASASVGKFLAAGLKPLVDALTFSLNLFNQLPGPVQTTVVAVAALTIAVAALTLGWAAFNAAAAAGVFTSITGAVAAVGTSLSALAATITTQAIAAFAGLEIMMLKNVAGIQGSLIPGLTTLQAKLTIAAGGSKALTVALAALNIGAIGAAIGAVELVWDTYSQANKGANDVAKTASEINKELTETMSELGVEVDATADAWERSKQRIGSVQATLDILRKGLGLTTAESVQLDKTTIALGESYGKIGSNVQSLILDYNQQVEALAGLEEGTKAYDDAVKELEGTEKAIEKAITKSIKDLAKRKTELLAGRDATEDLTEEEQRLLSVINSLISGFQSQKSALSSLRPEIEATTVAQKKLNEEMDAKAEAKAAGDAYNRVKEDFEGTMKAMETAFGNMKNRLKEGLDSEVASIKANVEQVKDAAKSMADSVGDSINAVKRQGQEAKRASDQVIASLKAQGQAQVESINRALAASRQSISTQISNAQASADRQIAQIDGISRASASASRSRIKGINAAAKAGQAALEASARKNEAYAANEIKNIRNASSESKKRFDNQISDANKANDRILANYDAQLQAIQRAKDATTSQYDAALSALAELTPAEQQLARIEEARLRRTAAQGGEEGLRAQAQLERAARNKQADELREQKAQQLAQLEAQAEAVQEQRRTQEIVHENEIAKLQSEQAAAQVRFAAQEQAVQEQAAARAEEIAARQRALAEQAEAQREAELEAEEKRQERLAEQKRKIEEKLAAEKKRLEEELREAELKAEEKIRKEKEETAKKVKKEQEEAKKREEERAKQIEKLEDEIKKIKEQSANAEKQADNDIAKAKGEYKRAEAQAEQQFNDLRNQLLTSYNEAIGKTTNYIIAQGAYTWRTYANNAVAELSRVQAAAARAAQAISNARSAASGSTSTSGGTASGGGLWSGGPASGGTPYTVNEYGQEAFLSRGGDLSLINAPAWGTWRPKTDGFVLPASVTANLGVPKEGINLGKSGASMAAASRSSAAGGPNMARLVKAIQDQRPGDTIHNNVTIQSDNTTQAASDMLVDLTRVKHRRYRR